jgi:hypothetical protein
VADDKEKVEQQSGKDAESPTGGVPNAGFVLLCPTPAGGCGNKRKVANAGSRAIAEAGGASCPVCGHATVVLDDDEQRTTADFTGEVVTHAGRVQQQVAEAEEARGSRSKK